MTPMRTDIAPAEVEQSKLHRHLLARRSRIQRDRNHSGVGVGGKAGAVCRTQAVDQPGIDEGLHPVVDAAEHQSRRFISGQTGDLPGSRKLDRAGEHISAGGSVLLYRPFGRNQLLRGRWLVYPARRTSREQKAPQERDATHRTSSTRLSKEEQPRPANISWPAVAVQLRVLRTSYRSGAPSA